MKLYFETLMIWFGGIFVLYFSIASVAAFVSLDWAYLDFTNWDRFGRLFMSLLVILYSILVVAAAKHKGVFDQ